MCAFHVFVRTGMIHQEEKAPWYDFSSSLPNLTFSSSKCTARFVLNVVDEVVISPPPLLLLLALPMVVSSTSDLPAAADRPAAVDIAAAVAEADEDDREELEGSVVKLKEDLGGASGSPRAERDAIAFDRLLRGLSHKVGWPARVRGGERVRAQMRRAMSVGAKDGNMTVCKNSTSSLSLPPHISQGCASKKPENAPIVRTIHAAGASNASN